MVTPKSKNLNDIGTINIEIRWYYGPLEYERDETRKTFYYDSNFIPIRSADDGVIGSYKIPVSRLRLQIHGMYRLKIQASPSSSDAEAMHTYVKIRNVLNNEDNVELVFEPATDETVSLFSAKM